MTNNVSEIIKRWTQRREEWARLGANVSGSALADEVIRDIETLTESNDEQLNLTQAAELSGYSADHIGRLVRDGTLNNYGKKGSPRVKRSELPMRAKPTLPRSGYKGYDAIADARQSLGVRR